MSHLLDEMAKDMKIYPYQGEDLILYRSRLVYSAIAHWIRYISQDYLSDDFQGKSKAYILKRASEELNAFIITFPDLKDWFCQETSEIEDVIRDIRNKMLGAGELVEINSCEKITLPEYCENACGEGVVRVIGISKTELALEHIGVTRIFLDSKREFISTSNQNVEQFFEWIYKNAKWGECNNINDFELFDSYSKKPPYQSWTDKKDKSQKYHFYYA